jgi:SAM-dependent methyltransferase
MTTSFATRPANFTRHSPDFVKKFVRERQFHFIPLFWLLRLSDFAREGIEHSGSYRFADHMYRGLPSGRGWVGRWLDAMLLKLPATRSMRQRCFESSDAMRAAFQAHLQSQNPEPFRIMTVPCGLPRDVRDFAAQVATENPAALARIEYTGIDLDPAVIEAARAFLQGSPLRQPQLQVGNALAAADYPPARPHFIASTGFGEFLDDTTLASFYKIVFDVLAPGGTFFTSAAARGRGSDVLLRAFELEIYYRTSADIKRVLATQPWASVQITRDSIGLQTFLRATKGDAH